MAYQYHFCTVSTTASYTVSFLCSILLIYFHFYISVLFTFLCVFSVSDFFFKFDFRRACVTYTISSMGIGKVFLILISDFDFGPQQSQLEMS